MVWNGKSWLENAALAQPDPQSPSSLPPPPVQLSGTFLLPPWTIWALTGRGSLGSQGIPPEGREVGAELTQILHFSCSCGAGAITHISSFHTSCTNELFIYCSALPAALIPSSAMNNISDFRLLREMFAPSHKYGYAKIWARELHCSCSQQYFIPDWLSD